MSTGRLGAGDTAIQPTILDAKADLITATAADTPARLGVGANGTVLTADSAEATGLKWATVSSGAVVQVKSMTTTTLTTITSATFTATNLTLSITPTSASNKILIFGQMPAYVYNNASSTGNYQGAGLRIVRGATNIFTSEPGEAFGWDNFDEAATGNMIGYSPIAFSYLDSPATTSSTTYTIQGNVVNTNGTGLFNYHNAGTLTLMEVTP